MLLINQTDKENWEVYCKYFCVLACIHQLILGPKLLAGKIVHSQSLTIPHGPDGAAETDKCCLSLETPALLNPLQMEETWLVVCQSLEHTKKTFKKPITEKRVWQSLSFKSTLTFEYNLFMPGCPVRVYFRDNCSDTGRPGFFLVVGLCRWRAAGQEGQHILREFRIIQQERQSLSAHIFTLRLSTSAKTLVYNVRFLYPHVYGWPKALGKSRTFPWKLYIEEFWHNWVSDATTSHVFTNGETTSCDFLFFKLL